MVLNHAEFCGYGYQACFKQAFCILATEFIRWLLMLSRKEAAK